MLIQGRFTYTLPGSTTLWRIYNARGVLALAWNPMLPICHTTRGSERVSIARPFDARRCVGVVACALGLWLTFGSNLLADVWEAFESADTAWQVAESDCALRKLVHERTWKEAHGGHASEHLHLSVGAGSKVYLTYDIEPARVIEELVPRLWLKSDRVGPQLFVRVVLPRTKEPRTGRPITALIPGDTYSDAGVWQPLSFKNVPLLLERQVRVLRQQFGSDIDPREAYIDKIVINAFSEPGPIKLWIDDLEVTGHVAVAERDKLLDATHRPVAFEEATSAPADRSVQLDGSLILAGGRPLPVRMIEHNGESLEWLQTAGFNAVWLREPATALQLTEAERLGLWLVAPPPTAQAGRITVTPAHASILAWSLGTKLGPLDVDTTRELARELRAADNVVGRPMIAGAIAPLAAYSRTANILLLDPPSLGGSFEMADYASWLAERPRFARPGTPCWAMLETEPAAEIYSQLAAVRPQIMPTPELDYQQLRLATFTAIASGARGILFQSRTRLDGQDRAAIQRIDTLRLLNAELRLVEPWMAAGTYVGEISVDDKQVRVSALQTERARLLVVRRYTNGQQFVIGGADKDRLSLVIPGTPSSSHVYRLSTLGMEPIVHKRITGGTHLAIESAGACSLVVITQDPLVLGRVARDLAALEAQHARLHYEVVLRKLETTGDAARRMPLNAFPNTSRALDQATANMQQALRLLSANDRRGAEKVVAAAELQLAEVQRGHLQAAALAFPSPIASAFCTQFNTLPVHYELSERLRTVTFGENVLPGGEMEELNSLIQSGWKHQRDPNVPVESAVELSPQPHGGQSSLHLSVFAGKPEDAPTLIETPPVWVTSPAINVAAGKMVRVRGFVRTSAAITGSQDGVLIFDSIGGRALGERIRATEKWQQFMLYRAVPADTTVNITFALTGLGDVWIDDVDICLLDLPQPEPTTSPTEEIEPPQTNSEALPAPPSAMRGWWPRLR